MSQASNNKNGSNAGELSLKMLLAGVVMMAIGSRVRLLAAVPLWLLGAASAISGASMRSEANDLVGGFSGEDKLWIKLKSSVSVMHATQGIYDYFRDPLNWPRFMPDIDVSAVGPDRYQITKRLAPGLELRQDILITEDLPYHRIAWVSIGENLPSRGAVEFTTNGGTYVTLVWEYKVACGPAINLLSKNSLRALNEVLLVKLQRFKQIMESGDTTIYGPTGCKSTSSQLLWHVLKADADRAFADLTEPAATEA